MFVCIDFVPESVLESAGIHFWTEEKIKNTQKTRVFCCCGSWLRCTYRVRWAGVLRAAQETWHDGSGPSCSASGSYYRCKPEPWPLYYWTKGVPLSPWWAAGVGSCLSSDCAEAWFVSASLRKTKKTLDGVQSYVHLLYINSELLCKAQLNVCVQQTQSKQVQRHSWQLKQWKLPPFKLHQIHYILLHHTLKFLQRHDRTYWNWCTSCWNVSQYACQHISPVCQSWEL